MTLDQLLIAASVRAAVVLAVACGLWPFLVLCRASAAARHRQWALVLTASLAVPLVMGLLPAWRVSVPGQIAVLLPPSSNFPDPQPVAPPPLFAAIEPPAHRPIQSLPHDGPIVLPDSTKQLSSEFAEPHVIARPISTTSWLVGLWSLGVFLTASPLLLGLLSLRLLKSSSRLVADGPLFSALQQSIDQLGSKRLVQLAISTTRTMPMTWGVWNPTILLPAAAETWPRERVQIVLLHELAHVARHDCLWQLVAQLARAMYWFNPLVWLANHQLRIEQERACDDLVLSRGFDPPDYADHLLAVSAVCSPVPASALALAMSRSTNLENRLMAILNPRLNRRPLSRSVTRVMAIVTIAATILVALTHVGVAVTVGDAEAQKDAKNDEPAAGVVDRSQALAVLRAKIADQFVTPVNDNDILEGALKGMISALKDPYSDYLTPQSLAEMERQIGSSIVGIGVQLEVVDKQIRVVTPLAGSPALKGGIQPGDVILDIDGESVAGLELANVVKRIGGAAGTNVRLRIGREGGQTLNLNIARGTVNLPTVKGFQLAADNHWNFFLDNPHKIGYVQFSQFGAATPREAREAIESLKQQGVKGLILDLRFCPGGTLDSAVGVAKLFLSSGTIVTLHPRTGEPTTLKSDAPAALGDVPLLVLVNEQTASSAEILAGALQDNQRAVVLGTRTTGKASVQTLIKLDGDSGAIKLTTAEYRLPSGRNIDKRGNDNRVAEKTWGINPDDGYFVPLSPVQSILLLERRRQREIIQAEAKKDANNQAEVTPASLEQEESDPQLATALKAMIARLQSGAFAKVSTLTAAQIDQFVKRQEVEQRRETARRTLEQIDRELAELN